MSRPRYFEPYHVADAPTDAAPRRSPTRWTPLVFVLVVAVFAGWVLSENYDAIMARLSRPPAVERDARPGDDRHRATDVREGTTQEVATPAVGAGSDAGEATDNRPARAADRLPATASGADPSAPGTAAESGRATAPTDGGRATQPADDRPEEPAARVAEREAEVGRAVEKKSPVGSTNDLSGRWTLTNRVESSSYAPYTGMNVGFHLQLQQDGTRVTGAGQKWMENGRPLPPGRRTPISVEGTLTGNRLELTFNERGTRRTSAGTLVMTVAADGTMQGTFASDAANAQGTSLARRAEPPRQ
jgi:hypothetical protein